MLLPVAKSFPNKFKIVQNDCICLYNKKLFGFVLRLFDCVCVCVCVLCLTHLILSFLRIGIHDNTVFFGGIW
jgi:hypothetical protein